MISIQDFKEMLDVETIEFNQRTEGKHAYANVKGINIIVAHNFDESKPAYLKKGLEDAKGNTLDAEAYVLFNVKDAIRTFIL
jgi:hypothetical protein